MFVLFFFFMLFAPHINKTIAMLFKKKKNFRFDGRRTNKFDKSITISDISITLIEIINITLQTGVVPGILKVAKLFFPASLSQKTGYKG